MAMRGTATVAAIPSQSSAKASLPAPPPQPSLLKAGLNAGVVGAACAWMMTSNTARTAGTSTNLRSATHGRTDNSAMQGTATTDDSEGHQPPLLLRPRLPSKQLLASATGLSIIQRSIHFARAPVANVGASGQARHVGSAAAPLAVGVAGGVRPTRHCQAATSHCATVMAESRLPDRGNWPARIAHAGDVGVPFTLVAVGATDDQVAEVGTFPNPMGGARRPTPPIGQLPGDGGPLPSA